MPDIVDGLLGLYRGRLGQWYGHTLVGTVAFCLPGGLILTWLFIIIHSYLSPRFGFIRSIRVTFAELSRSSRIQSDASRTAEIRNGLGFMSISVWVGALSHLFWDFISHGNCLWLYPFYENIQVFPSWWYTSWFDIRLPFYEDPYPFGIHLVVWIALTILGAILFFCPILRK